MTIDKFIDLALQHKEELKEKFEGSWFIDDIGYAETQATANLTYEAGTPDPRNLDPNLLGEETYEILKWDWEQWMKKGQPKKSFIIANFYEGKWPME